VLATKGLVLGKLEGHHGSKIMSMNQMAIGLENNPTTRLRNSSQDWNGPMGKKRR